MATENKLKLLNFACSLLSPDEYYLEIGTWKGATLVGALYKNECRAIAIDNFSQFAGSRAALESNLQSFGVRGSVKVIEGDAFQVAARGDLAPKSVGVYFYDGGHTYSDQYKALRLFEPFLKDDAIVVVDDTTMGQVFRANKDFVRLHSDRWSLLFDIPSPTPKEPLWWNGLQIFRFTRRGSESKREALADKLLFACGALANDVLLPRYWQMRGPVALRTRLRKLVSA
ncbi:MAG TPA: class I SAM-dependent methyltransferase [Polyangiaceae bacterium]|nr:class I SAM-dependent methyltransferase [Polyangiaceae bacterium]